MPTVDFYVTPNEMRTVWLKQLSTSDEAALAPVCAAATRYIESYCNRRFWTTTGDETKSFDVQGVRGVYSATHYYGHQTFDPHMDIASVTTLNLAESSIKATSGTYATISTGDYYLQPSDRPDDWPAQYIALTDEYSGTYNSSAPFMWFMPGMRTVQIVGKFGWNTTSIDSTTFPQEIRPVAAEIAAYLWRSRESGFSNLSGVNEVGLVSTPRVLSRWSQDILDRFRRVTSR